MAETEDPELDALTRLAIEVISLELLVLVERQAESQLPEGRYFNPTEDLQKSAANVPKTNVNGERDMAVLDNLLREKPGQFDIFFLDILFIDLYP